jgi:hypothetical protein
MLAMTLAFTLTYDDFVEAHKIHRRPPRRERVGLGDRLLFLWIVLATLLALVAICIVEVVVGMTRGGAGGTSIPVPVTNWAVAIAVQWMPYLVVYMLLWFAASGILGPNDRPWTRQMFLVMTVLSLFNAIIAAVVTGGPYAQQAPAQTEAQPRTPWILNVLPWFTMFIAVWIYIFRYLRTMLPRLWDAQPHLRLPNTVTAHDDGLRVEDANATHDYRWPAFVKFRESDRLFLLYVSQVSFIMIPKRAMPEPGNVEAFRQLLERNVAGDGPVPARFPLHEPVPA